MESAELVTRKCPALPLPVAILAGTCADDYSDSSGLISGKCQRISNLTPVMQLGVYEGRMWRSQQGLLHSTPYRHTDQ